MGFKSLNPGPLCSGRGLELMFFGFRHKASDDPDKLWQAGANAVTSVVKDATTGGTYTVQLNKPYPLELVFATASVHSATATAGEIADARVDLDSYSPTAGTFDIEVYTDDGDGTLTVEQPTDDTAITVMCVFQRVTVLVEAHSV